MTAESREHVRRLKLRLAMLQRHRNALDPLTRKSALATAAGKKSALAREGDTLWGLSMSLLRWHAEDSDDD